MPTLSRLMNSFAQDIESIMVILNKATNDVHEYLEPKWPKDVPPYVLLPGATENERFAMFQKAQVNARLYNKYYAQRKKVLFTIASYSQASKILQAFHRNAHIFRPEAVFLVQNNMKIYEIIGRTRYSFAKI